MSRYMPLCYDIDSKKKKEHSQWEKNDKTSVQCSYGMSYEGFDVVLSYLVFLPSCEGMPLRYDCHTPYTKTKKQMFLKKNGPSLRGGGWGVGWRMLPKSLAALGQRNISPPTCTPCCIPVNIKYKNTTACCVAQ